MRLHSGRRAHAWGGIVIAAALGCAPGALAQTTAPEADKPDPIDAAYAACIEKDPSTAGMVGCADAAETAWDKALNEAYAKLLKELKGTPGEAALRTAQRAWVAQRDAEYKLHSAVHGLLQGTMWGPVMADQRMSIVKARALQLRAYIDFIADGRP